MRIRSLLFVPGDRTDRMEKAQGAGADALVLDLEDAVAPAAKPRARDETAAFLRRGPRPLPIFVRVNPLSSGLIDDDLAAVADAAPEGWLLPKAEGAESIRELVRRLKSRGAASARILPIASETPAAIFKLGEYGAVAEHLVGLTWGAEDLPAAVGAATSREPDGAYTPPYEMVRSLVLFAAHAAGVLAIDTVYPAFRDLEGLTRYAARGARDGFTGMMAIHPAQVAIINAAFSPSPEAVAQAQRVVAAFEAAPGAGVVGLDGRMLDAPHLRRARQVLAQADGETAPGAAAPTTVSSGGAPR